MEMSIKIITHVKNVRATLRKIKLLIFFVPVTKIQAHISHKNRMRSVTLSALEEKYTGLVFSQFFIMTLVRQPSSFDLNILKVFLAANQNGNDDMHIHSFILC